MVLVLWGFTIGTRNGRPAAIFDYAIDENPHWNMFRAERICRGTDEPGAGRHCVKRYILLQNGEDIFLIELAVFTGDEGQEGLLQVMLDTFTWFF